MHQGQRRHRARIEQVEVILANLVGQQQTLVVHRARRHRHHVELFAVLEAERGDRVRGAAAHDVELAFERLGDHHVGAAADEDLANHWLLGLHRRRHRHVAVDRHITPAEYELTFTAHRALDLFLARKARRGLLGHEHHAHPVLAGQGQAHTLRCHLFAIEPVGDLDQDAGTIALQGVGTDCATVVEVLQDLEALEHDVMCLSALDVGDETHATGIMFIGGIVKSLLLGQIHLVFLKRQVTTRVAARNGADEADAHKKAGRARTGLVVCTLMVQKSDFAY